MPLSAYSGAGHTFRARPRNDDERSDGGVFFRGIPEAGKPDVTVNFAAGGLHRSKKMPSRLWVILIMLCTAPAILWGQAATTSLKGTVSDSTGALIPNAQVVLTNVSLGTSQTVKTGGQGQYEFQFLAPGTYNLTVSAPGFRSYTRSRLQLLVSLPATANVQLQLGQSSQTVTVSASAVSLNTTDATLGNAMNNSTIEALPMEGRNVPDLLSLQPGVLYLGQQNTSSSTNSTGTDSRSGAVSGTRSDQNDIILDGVDDNSPLENYAFQGVLRSTLDSVQEFRVTTTNSNAGAGYSAGAQVVMVTKSGSNRFHGSLYEYNRNTAFTANDWFNKQSELEQGLPNKPGELNRNTFGASVGGPLKHNKLFFFANYEGQRTAENQQVTDTVPTASFLTGTIKYLDVNGNTDALDPAQIAGMDPGCSGNGTCPWGPGVDPNVLTILKMYPTATGTSSGDGLNTGSFTWSAPDPGHLNTSIARLDYVFSENNHLFARGNFQRDQQLGAPYFPGTAPADTLTSHAGGLAVGDTWMISPDKVNNLRYGLILDTEADLGLGNNSYVNFGNGLTTPVPETSTDILHSPVNNIVDDFTWVKGAHTLQFGVNYERIGIDTQSNSTSYNSASMGIGLLYQAAIANTGSDLDPAAFGYPAVSASFETSYDNDIMALTGLISYLNLNENYKVSGQESTLLPTGAIIPRDFLENDFSWYVQDQWSITPNLTLTYGVRHTLQQTPYEVNGQQVAPTINMNQWFITRQQQAALGNSVQPPFSFAPSGKANGGKPYWPMNWLNFAPRVAVAYSPSASHGIIGKIFGGPGRGVIRAGFGMYYDNYGPAIAVSFSQEGSFGLTSTITNPQNIWTVDDAPRLTCLTCIPTNLPTPIPPPAATQQYPVTPPTDIYGSGFAIAHGIDDALKTPYSINADLSFERQLRGGLMMEFDYVGTLGRNLLQQTDLAQPLDLVDPKSGMDYYGAAKLLSQAADEGKTQLAPIAYWEDMFPAAAGMAPDGQVQSATQNIYQYLWIQERRESNEIGGIGTLDALCLPLFPGGNPPCGGTPGSYSRFWPLQYSSLYSWDTIGISNYNAFQFQLKHPMSHGLQFDFGYTFGKSLDTGSDATRSTLNGGDTNSHIIDAWEPWLNYAPSDFDIRNDITADWVYSLPIGRGQALGGEAHGFLQALIGGWQFSGLNRWTSGLPFSIYCGPGWQTNWSYQSYCVQTGPIKTGLYYTSSGAPEVFSDPTALQTDLQTGFPWRKPYAGEVGSRNNFRGPGVFDIDTALAKSWQVHEGQALQFRWEVFNVTNSVRFNVAGGAYGTKALQNLSSSGSLGVFSATMSTPRVMQFSLRYNF